LPFKIKGITQRWLINSLGLILAVLFALEIGLALIVRVYFYNGVSQGVTSRASLLGSYLGRYVNGTSAEFEAGAKEFVESFSEKEKMEVSVYDRYGHLVIDSSGFFRDKEEEKPDYEIAVTQGKDYGEWVGKLSSGENVMAFTTKLEASDGSYAGAIRYVVSLTQVNRQIVVFIMILLVIGLAIIFFVMMSGGYFINSIVNPVRNIGATARKVAQGDFDIRLEKVYDDEIGDLCDTINYMAGELASSEELKNDFISSVSHELRTPLTAIKGWGETLMSSGTSDSETLEKGLSVIVRESERLSGIVEELLDFSKMQSGHLSYKMDKTDILAELMEAVVMLNERAKREDKQIVFQDVEDLPMVYGDKDRLKQVFVNVLDNAIKYSDQGCTVRVEAFESDGYINVIITDNGIGIPKEDLPNVTEKFYKARSSRRGSGIGLAVVEEIIRNHSGSLEITSEEGKGTVVAIKLATMQKIDEEETKDE